MSCPAALQFYDNCLLENNYNQNPVGDAQSCTAARLEYECLTKTFAATTCDGEAEAIAALERTWVIVQANCAGVGSGATAVFAGFVMLTVMTCVSLLH